MTLHNQIDYPLCTLCEGTREAEAREEYCREATRAEDAKAKRDVRNSKARNRYWMPENVEKRRVERAERRRKEMERRKLQMENAMKAVGEMFSDMF